MLRAYKFRMYPTKEQIQKLNQFIGTSRFIYNTYLYKKIQMYKNENKNYTLYEMKKDILLDVDEVICFSGFLQAVNEFMQTNYVIDDFKNYYIDEVAVPKERFNEFNKFISERNFYENAQILPNAVKIIKLLNNLYNIYICSSCVNPFDIIDGSGEFFKNKYEFLRKTLPFINPENIIFTSSKHLIQADIQIDDRLQNLDNKIATKILFPSYHNKDITDEELK